MDKLYKNFREMFFARLDESPEREAYVVKIKPDSPQIARMEEFGLKIDSTPNIGEAPADSGSFYRHVSFGEFGREVRTLGQMLLNRFPRGSHIAISGENRYEWCLSYIALATSGFVIVPVDKDLKEDEIRMVLTTGDVKALICSDKIYGKTFKSVVPTIEDIKLVVSMGQFTDEEKALAGPGQHMTTLEDILRGDEQPKDFTEYDEMSVDGEQLGVLIFTSGTTGVAKGVMLSQRNILSCAYNVLTVLEHGPNETLLSILPMHHTYECTCSFITSVQMGGRLAFCDGIRYIAKNFQEYRPTMVMLVPLIVENVHDKIFKQMRKSRVKYIGFRFLLFISGILEALGIKSGRRMFKQVHDIFGGRLTLLVAGAAPISTKVIRDFAAMGFKIRQGYGLTECSPILCVNRDHGNKPKSVGLALPNITLKLGDKNALGQGEILAKGDSIMMGYYKNEEATKAAFTEDGWFRTGDQGRIDRKGRVFIIGRIKNMIVTKTGKNIFPEELEAYVNAIPYVKECVVWGDDSNSDDTTICVTVVPNYDAIKAAGANMGDESAISAIIWEEIKKINKDLVTYKRIQRMDIRAEEFEKTTTSKVKRYLIQFISGGKNGQNKQDGSENK